MTAFIVDSFNRQEPATEERAAEVEERCAVDRRSVAEQARRVLGHGARVRRTQGDLGRTEGGRLRRREQRLCPGTSDRRRGEHFVAKR